MTLLSLPDFKKRLAGDPLTELRGLLYEKPLDLERIVEVLRTIPRGTSNDRVAKRYVQDNLKARLEEVVGALLKGIPESSLPLHVSANKITVKNPKVSVSDKGVIKVTAEFIFLGGGGMLVDLKSRTEDWLQWAYHDAIREMGNYYYTMYQKVQRVTLKEVGDESWGGEAGDEYYSAFVSHKLRYQYSSEILVALSGVFD